MIFLIIVIICIIIYGQHYRTNYHEDTILLLSCFGLGLQKHYKKAEYYYCFIIKYIQNVKNGYDFHYTVESV